MNPPLILFFACAGVAVIGALILILAREPIHSALALIVVMISLAVLYLLLGAEFIAAVQVIVYAGAIMVLFVFVIMLLNAGVEERTNLSAVARYVGLPLGVFLTLALAHWMVRTGGGGVIVAGHGAPPDPANTIELSKMLFRQYLFPFEATSILILIATLGALVLGRKEP